MTSDGTNTYSWDAENRMIKITYPGSNNFSTFVYDGMGRDVAIAETAAGSITSTKQFVWSGVNRKEERDIVGALTKKFFDRGQMNGATKYFYDSDHLGSVRDMTDNLGVVQAQYAFDPFGRVTKVSEAIAADVQYAAYYIHARSGLNMTRTRAYSAVLGRFISRDPIEEAAGINLFKYVGNAPTIWLDPSGLGPYGAAIGAAIGAGVGFGVGAGLGGTAGSVGGPGGTLAGAGIGANEFGVAGAATGAAWGDAIENAINSWRNQSPNVCYSKSKKGSKPKNTPPGTRPIDRAGLSKDDIHTIKDGVGAGPADWTGITPGGDVITSDSDGNAENHGHYSDYLL